MTVKKYLDLSTAHLTKDDSLLLDRLKNSSADFPAVDFVPPIVTGHGYGWWVHVPLEDDGLEDMRTWQEGGLSATFCAVIAKARSLNCEWVNFDQDADRHRGLPAFEW